MVSPKVLWPTEHADALRAYLAENAGSLATISALMNARFGSSYSRNAIVGKAQRLGLPPTGPKGKHTVVLKPKAEPPKPAEARKPAPSSPAAAVMRCVEVEPRHITLLELTDQTCKWPYGDAAPFTFCGHPQFARSFCGPHYYLSRRA